MECATIANGEEEVQVDMGVDTDGGKGDTVALVLYQEPESVRVGRGLAASRDGKSGVFLVVKVRVVQWGVWGLIRRMV